MRLERAWGPPALDWWTEFFAKHPQIVVASCASYDFHPRHTASSANQLVVYPVTVLTSAFSQGRVPAWESEYAASRRFAKEVFAIGLPFGMGDPTTRWEYHYRWWELGERLEVVDPRTLLVIDFELPDTMPYVLTLVEMTSKYSGKEDWVFFRTGGSLQLVCETLHGIEYPWVLADFIDYLADWEPSPVCRVLGETAEAVKTHWWDYQALAEVAQYLLRVFRHYDEPEPGLLSMADMRHTAHSLEEYSSPSRKDPESARDNAHVYGLSKSGVY